MKKTIQILTITLLSAILLLVIIFIFNPMDLRTKIISSAINSYLSSQIENYQPLDESSSPATSNTSTTDKNPLLSDSQEKTLESLGIDVSKLPTEITPSMETCFIEKLGQDRAEELIKGATPSAMDIFKTRDCLGE